MMLLASQKVSQKSAAYGVTLSGKVLDYVVPILGATVHPTPRARAAAHIACEPHAVDACHCDVGALRSESRSREV